MVNWKWQLDLEFQLFFVYLEETKGCLLVEYFKLFPKPFYQCLIVMVFHDQADAYVLVFYIPFTSKIIKIYCHTLHLINKIYGEKLLLVSLITFNSLPSLLDCFIHPQSIEMLTLIPSNRIPTKGIIYVCSIVDIGLNSVVLTKARN